MDLFSKEFEEKEKKEKQAYTEWLIEQQNKFAKESKVFAQILNFERTDDVMESTNNPKSLTRNAMIIRSIYKTIEEWEEDLKTSPFYSAAFQK